MNIDKDVPGSERTQPLDDLLRQLAGSVLAKNTQVQRKQRYNQILGSVLATTIIVGALVLVVAFVIWALRHLLG